MEAYIQTCPEMHSSNKEWAMPVLRGSGGHLIDPAGTSVEAEAIEKRARC